jgi:hypothetical protein
MWEKCDVYKICIGKIKQKKPLERPMRRLEDNVKMNLKWDANTLHGFNTQDSFQWLTLL